eukprot:CAMPEP_0168732552 /NCGR_PEP_ID=MMETSP0724-20121128/7829_1 /TAXON_ID=265536 /ORGANISM="Amphiprora sp., Strain CCMP467" /LENGTH=434 /DNA_ID=CAMNT_0008779573 /DNA_START=50 /DNA_END=1354 /DNA_ORIENTATION=+
MSVLPASPAGTTTTSLSVRRTSFVQQLLALDDEGPPLSHSNGTINRSAATSSSGQHSVRAVISGRLGGALKVQPQSYVDGDGVVLPPGEGTSLLGSNSKASTDHHHATAPAPNLSLWIWPALTCAAMYALYNIFIKKGSYSIHPILGGVVLQFVAALLGTALLAAVTLTVDPAAQEHPITYDARGLFWSVMAGLAVGTAEMLSFVVSGLGTPATQSIPIIIGGSVAFGALLGLILLGEEMLWTHGWLGVAALITGIGMVATDGGDKVEEGGSGDDDEEAPPLAIWIGPALICASAYAFYNIFIKKGSASINPILGGVILQFVAAIFGTILLGILSWYEGGLDYLNVDMTGFIWACCAGLAVGAAELLSFTVSGMGVPATQSIPIVIGGSVAFGAVLGLIMLGETLLLQGWLGVILLLCGIGVVATDPGEKVAGH